MSSEHILHQKQWRSPVILKLKCVSVEYLTDMRKHTHQRRITGVSPSLFPSLCPCVSEIRLTEINIQVNIVRMCECILYL